MDARVLSKDGQPGHYGLRGMRERAKLMGGKLAVWSELDSERFAGPSPVASQECNCC